MSEMVERVARALAEASGFDSETLVLPFRGPQPVTGDGYMLSRDPVPLWTHYCGKALAAIKAMAYMTPEMLDAGQAAMAAEGAHDCEVPVSEIYMAVIDGALK